MEQKQTPWIVVTGLDGSGKTTLVKNLAHAYEINVFTFHLPYGDFVIPALKQSGGGTACGDAWTDRLIFATDARITNTLLQEWSREYQMIISQRGWMDNFIFGKVQGVSYEEMAKLLRIEELQKPTAIICLNADASVAYSRIKNAKNKDKYETSAFIEKQAKETETFFTSIKNRHPALTYFYDIPNIFIDTTFLTTQETYRRAKSFLDQEKISIL